MMHEIERVRKICQTLYAIKSDMEMAQRAGVSRQTYRRFRAGGNVRADVFLRILAAVRNSTRLES